ncbi:hypothetical protein PQ469_30770 [Mucilaginibacter sp. KACC 22773]|uniref:hypothetical protein n=1 Tax=Mucilaginibacter sp. KACC 22773 TaxID=3025671 RepID=UPI002366EA75|nr:hypothetical protein [Mucilaginibacter sp. KACC 22773]WDF78273.1 hypothetical protein PQ469_30770 [Mucilaginibacter sp. KACC 22773]
MSVVINNLKVSPKSLKKGITAVTFTFDGFVTALSDNDVDLSITLDPTNPDVKVAAGSSPSWTATFKTTSSSFSKTINIEVKVAPPAPKITAGNLHAKANDNSTDDAPFTFIYS